MTQPALLCMQLSRLYPIVLLIWAVLRCRWIWSIGRMTLTGENWVRNISGMTLTGENWVWSIGGMTLTGENWVWSTGGMILTRENWVWSIGGMILTGENWVWSTGGMILTGENRSTGRRVRVPELHIKSEFLPHRKHYRSTEKTSHLMLFRGITADHKNLKKHK